jgi:hypothetical protein
MQPTQPEVVREIMESEAERTFWEVVRHHERPPFVFENESPVANRLQRAARVVLDGRIVPNCDGSFTVTGSENRQYRVAESCSCPQGQRGKSKACYHYIAVCLYIEWCRRTSSQPALPLGPATIEERLATAPLAAQEALGDDMPDDPDAYIPEPDDAPVATAILEPPAATRALTPAAPQVADLELALQTWTSERAIVQRFLKQELKANIDYYTLKIGGRESKPSLSKAGAEKVMGWLKLQASFAPDTGTWEMLGRPQDLVCYVCTLRTRSGEIVGEGRGARSIKKDGGDVNKAIKMAEKSANVSAVLRTGCLSDVFTQDAEDMQEPDAAKPTAATPTAQELRQRIWALVKQADPTITTREACAAFVQASTGLVLEPDHYRAIVEKLQQRYA